MKSPYRLRYAITFLISIALTFHFLQYQQQNNKRNNPSESQLLPEDTNQIAKPGFQVLLGNVTVHIGEELVNKENPPIVLNPDQLCQTLERFGTSLLILVTSSASNFQRRQAVRDTWGLRSLQWALNFRIVFIIGKSDDLNTLDIESARYGDLVQVDINESFRNLGHKSAIGLKWSMDHCKAADFVLKTDDDIMIHVPNLLIAIKSSKDPETLLMCHENRHRAILRKELLDTVPQHYKKYEVMPEELPGTYYPPYCSGMAYVFSNKVRDRLYWASTVTPVFFIEDVYLTGFCRHKAGILITPHSGITLRPPISKAQAACSFLDGRITSHEVGVDELRGLWAEANTQGFFCPQVVGYTQFATVTP